MSREWQQTKMTDYLMPEAVYYQSIWAVRDYQRMKARLEIMQKSPDKQSRGSVVLESMEAYGAYRPVEDRAMEIAVLKERVEGIRNALLQVPSEYRSYLISNIVMKNSGSSFGNKAWRMWKQIFLYQVAINLSIM